MDPKGLACLAVCLCCCARTQMPDPREAARAYEDAVEQGDAAALHALLSREAQTTYSPQDVSEILERDRRELAARAQACADPDAQVEAVAVVAGAEGAELGLALEDGRFRIDSDTALFPRPRTPEAALRALAWALESQQISRVEATLSEERRASLEERRLALLQSLAERDRALIRVSDHRAVVELPDGQVVELVEEEGVWRVEAVP